MMYGLETLPTLSYLNNETGGRIKNGRAEDVRIFIVSDQEGQN